MLSTNKTLVLKCKEIRFILFREWIVVYSEKHKNVLWAECRDSYVKAGGVYSPVEGWMKFGYRDISGAWDVFIRLLLNSG